MFQQFVSRIFSKKFSQFEQLKKKRNSKTNSNKTTKPMKSKKKINLGANPE